MANIMSGFATVTKIVNPAIKKPSVVIEKLKPFAAQDLISTSNEVA
jgi:hypothetical protein